MLPLLGHVCVWPEWEARFDKQMKSPFLTHPGSMAQASIEFGEQGSGDNEDGRGSEIFTRLNYKKLH